MSATQASETSGGSTDGFDPSQSPANESVDSNSAGSEVSLSRFFTLPQELQLRVLTLACQADGGKGPGRRLPLDHNVWLNLMCASQHFNSLLTPLRWAHIRITHASALLNLFETIAAHPERGALIRSLHLGPDGELVWPYFPLRHHNGGLHLYSSLDYPNDQHLAPDWLHHHGQAFPLLKAEPGSRGKAIHAALDAAMRGLDVSPLNAGMSRSRLRIGLASWALRVCQLQAALDLYLIGLRRSEDQQQGNDGPESRRDTRQALAGTRRGKSFEDRYPALIYHGTDAALDESAQLRTDVVQVTPAQLSAHLSRKQNGAQTDHFLHPIFLARSGHPLADDDVDDDSLAAVTSLLSGNASVRQPLVIPGDGEERQAAPAAAAGRAGAVAAPSSRSKSAASGSALEYLCATAHRGHATDEMVPNGESIGGLLAAARIIIAFSPNINNLALTGFFHRLLCGRNPVSMQSLRRLSIGPILPYWKKTFTSGGMAKLPNLEQLRLCVPGLTDEEASVLAGESGALSKSRRVQWATMKSDKAPAYRLPTTKRLTQVIQRLQGLPESMLSDRISATAEGRLREGKDGEEEAPYTVGRSSAVSQRRENMLPKDYPERPRYIEIHALDQVHTAILEGAPSQADRNAWQEGHAQSASTNRIHVVVSKASKAFRGLSVSERMYGESRRWWEEGTRGGGPRSEGTERDSESGEEGENERPNLGGAVRVGTRWRERQAARG